MFLNKIREKFRESLAAVLPIIGIVLVLSLTIAPLPTHILTLFLFGGLLVIVGMMFFSIGAELSMGPMGQKLGARITKTRRLPLILSVGFLLGFLITVSEPDLQVLAGQVSSIPSTTLIVSVAAGVSFFLVVALLRMLLGVPLNVLLIASYGLIFLLTIFAPADFLAVAFDSGGVTTGPMTVPFIMAFGVGISSIRNDRNASNDSFGLISLCSVGPILSVLVLSMIYHPDSAEYAETLIPEIRETVELGRLFLEAFPDYLKEILIALLPIVVIFAIFQLVLLRLGRDDLSRIAVGIVYTYGGLVLFLTGAGVGFMPAGSYLGKVLAGLSYRQIILPIGMLIGYFIVQAEPAVYVLMKQVEEITNGAISGRALKAALSVGVACSVGLAMLRVLTGISILWMVVPGYALAILLSFFCPKIFTAIAFDSGGVASGPMTAAFLLPFAMGACLQLGGNVVTDAFGVVAMVAMTPLIAIQLLGIVYRLRRTSAKTVPTGTDLFAELDNAAIIDL